MNTQDRSSPQTELNSILEILYEIRLKSCSGNYIYRGEPECYEKVSSTLYRKLEDAQVLHLDVEEVQKTELNVAKNYTNETDDFEILVQLQHFGGKTNLIDFTNDYLIALFFAANGSPSKDGRVILQDKTGEVRNWIREFQHPDPESRPAAQKSIFVRSPSGFIQPDESIIIPKFLKRPLLDYLEREYDISHRRVYYDLHGFISSRDVHWNVYEELGKSIARQRSGDHTDDAEEKTRHYQKAVEHANNAIQQMPELAEAHNIRGVAYFSMGNLDKAIDTFTEAIGLKPLFAEAYNGRSAAYRNKGDFDSAIKDSNTAIRLNPDDTSYYFARGLAYFSKGDLDNTIADYTKGVVLNPYYADGFHSLGLAYFTKGDLDKAMSNLNTAIRLNPDCSIFYHGRGLVYCATSDLDNAITDLDEAVRLDPDDATVYFTRGLVWLHSKDWDRAKADLIEAKNKGLSIINEFHNRYENISVFEQETGTELPNDIAAMLQG